MKKDLIKTQERVLGVLSGKMKRFYLAGGTALSLFYFHHRESADLDFFVHEFSSVEVNNIVDYVSETLSKKIELTSRQMKNDKAKIMVFKLLLGRQEYLKIDFVEDFSVLLKPLKLVNGINVLSLEDIYMRKINAACGNLPVAGITGRRFFKGGRQEAKDYYDLYCLSVVFMRLSVFAFKYGDQLMREAIIKWFRSYNRTEIKIGLLELKTEKKLDFIDIERHFKKEIDKIIEKEVEFI